MSRLTNVCSIEYKKKKERKKERKKRKRPHKNQKANSGRTGGSQDKDDVTPALLSKT